MATGRHTAHRRSPLAPLVIAATGAAVLLTTGFGVWAGLSATATSTAPLTTSSGTLSLTLANNGAGFTQPITAMAPGDTVYRFITLTQAGTLTAKDLTLAASSSATNNLTTGTSSLRVGITACTGTWTPTGSPTNDGTCNGTRTTLLAASTPLANAINAPLTLSAGPLTPGTTTHLRISLALPDTNEITTNGIAPTNSVQGLSTNLTWTFTQTQRTATTTSS